MFVACLAGAVLAASSLPAQGSTQSISGLSAESLFDVARRAEAADNASGDADAEAIYVALAGDPDIDVRQEARFRHGQLLTRRGKLAAAATLYRAILDERPGATRVRLELAAVLARLNDLPGARRALRQAQAGKLPPQVALAVDQYAAALRSAKPLVASLEVALAPSTNVNRATNATTLDTIIAPFELSDDARARSGVGVRLGGQVFARAPLRPHLGVTARLSGQGTLYRDTSFSDISGAGQIGLEIGVGKTLLRPSIGRSYRWYGNALYATTDTGSVSALRPIGKRGQIEVEAGYGRADYRLNDLQDGSIYTAAIGFERAFSQRLGGSLRVSGERQNAADPGFATASGTLQGLIWREAGRTSLFTTASLSYLGADARLGLFRDRREEWRLGTTVGATLRQFSVRGFAPIVRFSYERNRSSVSIYDYRLVAADIGITRAF